MTTESTNKQRPQSQQLFAQARQLIPGGVNSPVRAFKSVGVEPPIVVASASGVMLTDVDQQQYVDYVGAWGPHILGHADADVIAAIQQAATLGMGYGLATKSEIDFAKLLCDVVPNLEMVRLVNSGTEAVMSAIRLARGYTKRNKLIKFEGCYHGHADYLLVKAGSGLATLQHGQEGKTNSAPDSAGLVAGCEESTVVLPFNDLPALDKALQLVGGDVAALILEPVVGNMGVVPPQPGFLQGVRQLCDRYRVIFVIDEVMTGFRVALGGAQERYGVQADLACFSKIIGGGLPVGAYGGKRQIMQQVAPMGPVYQAGTLSGNPVTVAAGMATIKKLQTWRDPHSGLPTYDYLEQLGQRLESGLQPVLARYAGQLCLQRVGSMFTLFFTAGPVRNWNDSSRGDHSPTGPYARFFQALLKRGILFPPSSYEAAFISLAHTPTVIDQTVVAISEAVHAALGESP